MLSFPRVIHLAMITLLVLSTNSSLLQAQTAEEHFYKAYYLEQAQHDFSAAADLYKAATESRGASSELRTRAKARLATCREELATSDLARLMPPDPLAYVEINRPGERVRKLVDQLGLLAHPENPPTPGEVRVAISPAIIDAFLGVRGLAAAVTGVDMAAQRPSGVAVLHPGNMDLVRGLIETALPAGGEVVEPISGYTTFTVEEAFVTLTSRLVIVGTSRTEIEGVIDRLNSPHEDSLATNDALADVLAERAGALAFFCINPRPLMPLLNGMLAGMAAQNRELAMANAMLDFQSLHSLTGRFDLSDQGVIMDVTLRLEEGHRNLVFDLLRQPSIDRETLRCVPAGTAAFFAMALNEAPQKYHKQSQEHHGRTPITMLDFGRELFANINGIAVYVLPPADAGSGSHSEIPDTAIAISVNDPAKSETLWRQMLGIGSMAAGATTMGGRTQEIEGVTAHSYNFDDEVTLHVGTLDHILLIATSQSAFAHSVAARKSGESVLDDEAFTQPISKLGDHTTLAVLAHPARCIEIGKQHMSPADIREAEPFIALMTDTIAMMSIEHSDHLLRLRTAVTGVPDISELVTRLVTEQRRGGQRQTQLVRAMQEKDWDGALDTLKEQIEEEPKNARNLIKAFDVLAVHKQDHAAAHAIGSRILEIMNEDANGLNNFAWSLLTEEKYGGQYDDLALEGSRRSNQLTELSNWYYVDTLALAEFRAGHAEKAVKLEEKAIELCRNSGSSGVGELEAALERFQQGVAND